MIRMSVEQPFAPVPRRAANRRCANAAQLTFVLSKAMASFSAVNDKYRCWVWHRLPAKGGLGDAYGD